MKWIFLCSLAVACSFVYSNEIYENPFKNNFDFVDHTFNYNGKLDYGDGNITTFSEVGTTTNPTFTPLGFDHIIGKSFVTFYNQLSGQQYERTFFYDVIDGSHRRAIVSSVSSLLGLERNDFKYADGTPKTQYIRKGEIWDSFTSTRETGYRNGKWWIVIGNHNDRFTVLGLKNYGYKKLLEIKSERYSTFEFWDFRRTVGSNINIRPFPAYYFNATKTSESVSLCSKKFVVSETFKKFSLDNSLLKTYGDDSEDKTYLSGETEEDIKKQIVDWWEIYDGSTTLESIYPNIEIEGFTSLNASSFELLNPQLNSWTWNGAFPWVYNSASDSWFYYAFSGNSYNAYDARSGSWFTFDSDTGTWNPYN